MARSPSPSAPRRFFAGKLTVICASFAAADGHILTLREDDQHCPIITCKQDLFRTIVKAKELFISRHIPFGIHKCAPSYDMLNFIKHLTRPYRWLHRMLKRHHWSRTEFPYAQLHFGQFGEDCVLLSLFGERKTGIFIDVGAFHPIYFSNTHNLSKRGWTGINIEPNPESFKLFPDLRPRDININAAISSSSEQRQFLCDGPYSGFCDDQSMKFRAEIGGSNGTDRERLIVPVKSMPLSKVIADHVPKGEVVDLITIDCEGADLEVLQGADWNSFRPRVVLVEDHDPAPESAILEFMRAQGYGHYLRIGLTRFFLEPEFAKSARVLCC